jgi:hypothetical protein
MPWVSNECACIALGQTYLFAGAIWSVVRATVRKDKALLYQNVYVAYLLGYILQEGPVASCVL